MAVEPLSRSSLELDEALPVQRWFWRFEWVLLAVVSLVVAGSLAGLFGGGWLSEVRLSEGGEAVRYERFVRFEKTTVLEVVPAAGRVVIPARYLDDFELSRVVPAPRVERAVDGDVVFEFAARGATPIRFYLTPRNPARQTSAVVRTGAARFEISQFTFP